MDGTSIFLKCLRILFYMVGVAWGVGAVVGVLIIIAAACGAIRADAQPFDIGDEYEQLDGHPIPKDEKDPDTCVMGEFLCHHAEYHSWYTTWHNDNGGSCCNGKDCRPARFRESRDGDGGWEWYFPEGNRWIAVPQNARRSRQEGDPDHGHICTSPPIWNGNGNYYDPTVYCYTIPQLMR